MDWERNDCYKFPVVETTGYIEKRCLKENIACGFNRRNTESIHNDCKFASLLGLKMCSSIRFPWLKPRAMLKKDA
jgi:hypothetical protein